MSRLRVGILGARRKRQGLGPYVARDLVAAGADVPCILGTRAETLEEAKASLAQIAGVEPRGYLELGPMLAEESLDALAILSPAERHAEHLEAAAEASLHVLCEKPFVWDVDDPVARCAAILARFEERGLLLVENCQWPYTLEGFAALHPGALEGPPRHFAMELEPVTRGVRSLADALPHALSLLQALVPGEPAVEDVHYSTRDPGADGLTVRFRYRTESHACDAEVSLQRREKPPRRAAYALDGRRARRVVSPKDYSLSFADSDRTVPIADPLTQLVAEFVATLGETLRGAPPPPTRRIHQRMQLLAALAAVHAEESP